MLGGDAVRGVAEGRILSGGKSGIRILLIFEVSCYSYFGSIPRWFTKVCRDSRRVRVAKRFQEIFRNSSIMISSLIVLIKIIDSRTIYRPAATHITNYTPPEKHPTARTPNSSHPPSPYSKSSFFSTLFLAL